MFFKKKIKAKVVPIPEFLNTLITAFDKKNSRILSNAMTSSPRHKKTQKIEKYEIEEPKEELLCCEAPPWVCEPNVPYTPEEIKKIPLGKSFRELLFFCIDRKGLKDSEVYNKAFVDRRTFSKIRTKENYKPSFGTVTLLALALELNYSEYVELLKSATYALPDNQKEFVVIRYVFINEIYDIQKVNDYLFTICHKTLDEL